MFFNILSYVKKNFNKLLESPTMPFILFLTLCVYRFAGILKIGILFQVVVAFACFTLLVYYYESFILLAFNSLLFQVPLFFYFKAKDFYNSTIFGAISIILLFTFYPWLLFEPTRIFEINGHCFVLPDLEILALIILFYRFFLKFDSMVIEPQFVAEFKDKPRDSIIGWDKIVFFLNSYFKLSSPIIDKISRPSYSPKYFYLTKRFTRTEAMQKGFTVASGFFATVGPLAGLFYFKEQNEIQKEQLEVSKQQTTATVLQAKAALEEAIANRLREENNKIKALIDKSEFQIEAESKGYKLEGKGDDFYLVKVDVESTINCPSTDKKGWLSCTYEETFSSWFWGFF